MATCRRLDLQELQDYQHFFKPFLQNFASLYVPDTFSPKDSKGHWSHENANRFDCCVAQLHSQGREVVRNPTGEPQPQQANDAPSTPAGVGHGPIFTTDAGHEAAGRLRPACGEGTVGLPRNMADAALVTPLLLSRFTPSEPSSIPASIPPVNTIPQTCFKPIFVPESLLDSAGRQPSAGCGADATHMDGMPMPPNNRHPAFFLQHASMVPETCLEDADLQMPPVPTQLPRPQPQPLLEPQLLPQLPADSAQGCVAASNHQPTSARTEARTGIGAGAATPTPLAANDSAEFPGTPKVRGLANGAPAAGHCQEQQPMQHHTSTPEGGALAAAGEPTAACDPDRQLARTEGVCCLPVPPPGYDFDLDAQPDPGFVGPPTGSQAQQFGMPRSGYNGGCAAAGSAGSGRGGGGSVPGSTTGAAVPVFDYLLDEPTPPPKQLPKGTRLLKPGQRAAPVPPPAPAQAPALHAPPMPKPDPVSAGAEARVVSAVAAPLAAAKHVDELANQQQRDPEQRPQDRLPPCGHAPPTQDVWQQEGCNGFSARGPSEPRVPKDFLAARQQQPHLQQLEPPPAWRQQGGEATPGQQHQQQEPDRGQPQFHDGVTDRVPPSGLSELQCPEAAAAGCPTQQLVRVAVGGLLQQQASQLQHSQQVRRECPPCWPGQQHPQHAQHAQQAKHQQQLPHQPLRENQGVPQHGWQQQQWQQHQHPHQQQPGQPAAQQDQQQLKHYQWDYQAQDRYGSAQPPAQPQQNYLHNGQQQQQQQQHMNHQQHQQQQTPHMPQLTDSWNDPNRAQFAGGGCAVVQHPCSGNLATSPQPFGLPPPPHMMPPHPIHPHPTHPHSAPPNPPSCARMDPTGYANPSGDGAAWQGPVRHHHPQQSPLPQPQSWQGQPQGGRAHPGPIPDGSWGPTPFGGPHLHQAAASAPNGGPWIHHQQQQPLPPPPQQQHQQHQQHQHRPNQQNQTLPPPPQPTQHQHQHQQMLHQNPHQHPAPSWHPQPASAADMRAREPSPPAQRHHNLSSGQIYHHQLSNHPHPHQQPLPWQPPWQPQHHHHDTVAGNAYRDASPPPPPPLPQQQQQHGVGQTRMPPPPPRGRREASPSPPPAAQGRFPQAAWEPRGPQQATSAATARFHTPPGLCQPPTPSSANGPWPQAPGPSPRPPHPHPHFLQTAPQRVVAAPPPLLPPHLKPPAAVPEPKPGAAGPWQPSRAQAQGVSAAQGRTATAALGGGAASASLPPSPAPIAAAGAAGAAGPGYGPMSQPQPLVGQRDPEPEGGCGFRTAADRPIHLSAAARQRASAFWTKVMDEEADGGADAVALELAAQVRKEGATGLGPGLETGVRQGHDDVPVHVRERSGGAGGQAAGVEARPGGGFDGGGQVAGPAPDASFADIEIPPTVPLTLMGFEDYDLGGPAAPTVAVAALPTVGVEPATGAAGSPVAMRQDVNDTANAGTGASGATVAAGAMSPAYGGTGEGAGADGGGGFVFASGRRPQISAAALKRGAAVLAKALAPTEHDGGGAATAAGSSPLAAGDQPSSGAVPSGKPLSVAPAPSTATVAVEADSLGGEVRQALGTVPAAFPGASSTGCGPGHPHTASSEVPRGSAGVQAPVGGGDGGGAAGVAFAGFSTAGGKPVAISEAARKRAAGWLAKLLRDDEREGHDEGGVRDGSTGDECTAAAAGMARSPQQQAPAEGGPTAVADSRAAPAADAARRAPAADGAATASASAGSAAGGPAAVDIDAGGDGGTSPAGFSTAGGKPIAISEAARKRAAGWLASVLQEEKDDDDAGVSKAPGINGNPPATRDGIIGCGLDVSGKGAAAAATAGPSAASSAAATEGRRVASGRGLGRGRGRFGAAAPPRAPGPAPALTPPPNQQALPPPPPGDAAFSGFSTAAGRLVVVSEAARQRAAGFLAKVFDDDLQHGTSGPVDGSGCHSTAVGAAGDPAGVSPSVAARANDAGPPAGATRAAGDAVQDEPVPPPEASRGVPAVADNRHGSGSGVFCGFSTAGGRPVVVSEAARKRAAGFLAKVLQGDDGDDGGGDVGDVAPGARIAGGGGDVSGDALGGTAPAAALGWQAGDAPGGASMITAAGNGATAEGAAAGAAGSAMAVGFSTAGGKPVVISEAARKRAAGWLAKLLSDDEGEGHDEDGVRDGTVPAASAAAAAAGGGGGDLSGRVSGFRAPAARPARPLRAPRGSDGSAFKQAVRHAATGPLSDTDATAATAAAAVGTADPALAPAALARLPTTLSPRPRLGAENRSGGGGSGVGPSGPSAGLGFGFRLPPAASIVALPPAASVVALPPAATALPRASLTFASGRQVVLSEAARKLAAAWLDKDSGAGEPGAQAAAQGDGEQAETPIAVATVASDGGRVAADGARLAAAASLLRATDAQEGGGAGAGEDQGTAGPCSRPSAGADKTGTGGGDGPPGAQEAATDVTATPCHNSHGNGGGDGGGVASPPPGLMTEGSRAVTVSEEHRRAAAAMLDSAEGTSATTAAAEEAPPAASSPTATALGHSEGRGDGAGSAAITPGGPQQAAATSLGREQLEAEAGTSGATPAPRRPASALPAGTSTVVAVASPVGGDATTTAAAAALSVAAAAAAAAVAQRTPLRSLPTAAAALAAAAAAAVTPLAATPRHGGSAAAATPATGLRGPPPSTGGLKRPRPPGEGGAVTGLTHGRPPRQRGPAAASVGGKRKFVSPVPAGYKGKPGAPAIDCQTPLGAGARTGCALGLAAGAPGAASGAEAGPGSSRRRGGPGSPKRPRLSSLFDLEAGSGRAAAKLPLREYFALPPAPPSVGPTPPSHGGTSLEGAGRGCLDGQPVPVAGMRHLPGGEAGAAGAPQAASAAVSVGDPAGGPAGEAEALDDVAAAIAAAAPGSFTPLTQSVLDGIIPANAAEFRFWVAAAPPTRSPSSPHEAKKDADMVVPDGLGDGTKVAAEGGAGAAGGDDVGAGERPVWGWWGAAEARAALQQLPVLPASARDRATEPWFSNHYRWIVWKLAAYERRFPAHCRGRSLTPAAVLDQLRRRVQVELVGGGRPILAAILAHDRPAGLPMVLAISGLPELLGRSHFAEGMRIELTDGWYSIAAGLDGPLAQLVLSGRLVLGSKLRVCGADLQSERPGEPLDPATRASSAIRLHYNGCSSAPWDARLGAQVQPAAMALRPLALVSSGGGAVPATLLLVAAKYGILTFENTPLGAVNRTPRAQEERLRSSAAQRNEAAAAAATAVQRAELDRCRGLLRGGPRAAAVFSSTCSASFATLRVQRAYATMVVRGGGGGEGGGDGGGGGDEDGGGGGGVMSSEEQAQLSRLVSERQAYMSSEVTRLAEEAINGKDGSGPGGGGGGGGDCGVPYLRLRVVAVTPHGVSSGTPYHAVLRMWRPPPDLDEQLREGQVVLATNLVPSAYGSSGGAAGKEVPGGGALGGGLVDLGPNGRLRCLELTASKMTRFRILGQAAELTHHLALPGYQPRRQLRLADIGAALPAALQQRLLLLHRGAPAGPHDRDRDVGAGSLSGLFEFDFTGCVVRVGEIQHVSGGVRQQWVFLADQTSGLCNVAMPAEEGGGGGGDGGGGGGGPQPWMLAVKMFGAPESVDFLPDPARQTGAVLSFRHLVLLNRDAANQLWVAAATDTASVARVAPPPPPAVGGSAASAAAVAQAVRGGDPVLSWVRAVAGREQLALYGAKIDRLLGGD